MNDLKIHIKSSHQLKANPNEGRSTKSSFKDNLDALFDFNDPDVEAKSPIDEGGEAEY